MRIQNGRTLLTGKRRERWLIGGRCRNNRIGLLAALPFITLMYFVHVMLKGPDRFKFAVAMLTIWHVCVSSSKCSRVMCALSEAIRVKRFSHSGHSLRRLCRAMWSRRFFYSTNSISNYKDISYFIKLWQMNINYLYVEWLGAFSALVLFFI